MSETISCRSGFSLYPPVMLMQPSPIAETSRPLAPRVRLSMVRAPPVAGEPFPADGDHLTTALCTQGDPADTDIYEEPCVVKVVGRRLGSLRASTPAWSGKCCVTS